MQKFVDIVKNIKAIRENLGLKYLGCVNSQYFFADVDGEEFAISELSLEKATEEILKTKNESLALNVLVDAVKKFNESVENVYKLLKREY